MRTNTPAVSSAPLPRTHEGGPAKVITAEQALRRSVLSCLLWESEFYEDGAQISQRIASLVEAVDPAMVCALAIEARNDMNLRHVPLFLTSLLARRRCGLVAELVPIVVQRADELAELVTIHCMVNGVKADKAKKILGHQLKKGLAAAFQKFDAYQLAKYDRKDNAIRLRDVLFMCHAEPKDEVQAEDWKRLVEGTLPAPDTWEVGLSAGQDKKGTFERLLRERKIGYLALLRNLRNMINAGVDQALIEGVLSERKGAHRVLPFRFVAAARACPQLEPAIDRALVAQIDSAPKLPGMTAVLVDVSASMKEELSRKSDLRRMDAACALAAVVPVEDMRLFSFSQAIVEVPPRRGMAGIDALAGSQRHGGTDLGGAVRAVNQIPYDRLIVITDEQSASPVPDPAGRGYMINVASNRNGVGYGKWIHVDGFSEAIVRWICELECNSMQ